MQSVRTILREVLGLFVDDGSFALVNLVWIALLGVGTVYFHRWSASGVVLAVGFAIILVESVTRFARKRP